MITRLKVLAGPAAPGAPAAPVPPKEGSLGADTTPVAACLETTTGVVTTAGIAAGVVTPVKTAAGVDGTAVAGPDLVCQLVELELQITN